eukprot:639755-Pelagomonas_calceolata.AAC.1
MPSDAAFTNFLEGNTINEFNWLHFSAASTSQSLVTLTVVPSPLIAGTGLTLANLVENPSLVKQ